MKVYLVTTGSYSDYSVAAVFSDRALAEAHRLALSDANEVEEYELLDKAPKRFMVYNKGNDTYVGTEPHEWTFPEWSYNRGIYKRAETTTYRSAGGHIAVRVSGWDQGAVLKAFDDRIAAIRAKQVGP